MAAISTLGGDFTTAEWSKGVDWTSAVATRLRGNITGSAGFTDTGTPSGYDLTGSTFTFKMSEVPECGQTSVELRDAGGTTNYFRILRSSSAHTWAFQKTGVATGTTWTDAVLRANPWCRFRESGGTTFFEVSANGTSGWATPSSGTSATNLPTMTNIEPSFRPANLTGSANWHWVIEQVNGTAEPASKIVQLFPTSILSAGAWTGAVATLQAVDASFATNTGATQNTEYPIDVQFDTSGIPSGATINSVRIDVSAKPSAASRSQIKVEGLDNTTSLGNLALTTMTLTSDSGYSATLSATYSQVTSANFKARVIHKRTASQASTLSVNSVILTVEYTPAAGGTTYNADAALAGTSALAATSLVAHEALAVRPVTAALVAAADVVTSTPKAATASTNFANTAVWTVTNGTATSTDVTLPPIVAGASAYSVDDYDLLGSEIFFKIDQLHTQSSVDVQTSFYMRVAGSNANMLRFLITSTTTTVYMRYYVASAMTQAGSYAWSATRPWLKISEAAGVVTWWDSADGVSWAPKATWTHGSAINLADLELSFQALDGAGGVSGSSIISHVNVPGVVVQEAGGTLGVTSAGTAAATITREATGARATTAGLTAAATVTEAVWAADSALAVTAGRAAAATIDRAASAPLAVTAAFTASATVVDAVWAADSALAVTAGRASTAAVVRPDTAPIALSAGLLSTAAIAREATGTRSATAALSASVLATHEATAPLVAVASFTAVGVTDDAALEASAVLQGVATLTAAATVTDAVWAAVATLPVTAVLASAPVAVHESAGPRATATALTSASDVTRPASAPLAASSAMLASVGAIHEAVATLGVTAGRAAATTVTHEALAVRNNTAVVTAGSFIARAADGVRMVQAGFGAAGAVIHEATASLVASAVGVTLGEKLGSHEAIGTLPVTAGRAAAAVAIHPASGALAATAGWAAAGQRATPGTAVAPITVGLTASAETFSTAVAGGARGSTAGLVAAAQVVRAAEAVLHETMMSLATGGRATAAQGTLPIISGSRASASAIVLDVESVWDVIVGDRDLNITSPSGGLATTIKQRELSVTVGSRETS